MARHRLQSELKKQTKIEQLEMESLQVEQRCDTLQMAVDEKSHTLEKAIHDYQELMKEVEECNRRWANADLHDVAH